MTEQEGFAQAVLGAGLPPGWSWLAAGGRLGYVALAGLSFLGLVAAAVLGEAEIGLAFLVVAAVTDWSATVAGTEAVRLLDRAGAHARLRALGRGIVVIVLLAEAAPRGHTLITFSYAALVGVVQLCWLTYCAGAGWLASRQPPLLVATSGPQPAASVSYAVAYARGSGSAGGLLAADVFAVAAMVAGMHAPRPAIVAVVVAGVTAAVTCALAARAGLQVRRLGSSAAVRDLERAAIVTLGARSPRVIIYMSAGPGQSKYILNQWLGSFEAMRQTAFVMVREATQLAPIATTSLPVVYAPSTRHVEVLTLPGTRIACYLANAGRNVNLLREAGLKHVFLNHGDSDKSTSANPVSRVYDEVWVAGEAAVDRYAAAGIDIARSHFAVVGRPQVQHLLVGRKSRSAALCVLYAPTFEGYYEESNYSSLEVMGVPLVRSLLAGLPGVRVVFKPHPSTGIQRPGMRRARLAVERLLRQAPGGNHLVADDHPELTLYDCFDLADLLISDVSSVVTDFLHTERPIVVANPKNLPLRDFYQTFPTQRASYVVGSDLAALDDVLAHVLGRDPLAPARRDMKAYVLGDLPLGPLAAFTENVDRLCALADVDLRRIRNNFRVKETVRGESSRVAAGRPSGGPRPTADRTAGS